MRCVSAASQLKRPGHLNRKDRPSPGTRLGYAYDVFTNNKGVPIHGCAAEIFGGPHSRRAISDLRDYYGLDIRCVDRGGGRARRGAKWVLAGEWFGRVYVDYIAERLSSSEGSSP